MTAEIHSAQNVLNLRSAVGQRGQVDWLKTPRMPFRQVRTTPNYQAHWTHSSDEQRSCVCAICCARTVQSLLCFNMRVFIFLYSSMFPAFVMFYSAVDFIRSVRLFYLCGLIIAPAAVSTDVLFFVGNFFLIVWVLSSCLVNWSEATLRKVIVYL